MNKFDKIVEVETKGDLKHAKPIVNSDLTI